MKMDSLQPIGKTEETTDSLLDERLRLSRMLNGLKKKLSEIQESKTNSVNRIWKGNLVEDEQKIVNQISETEEQIKQADHDLSMLSKN